MASSALINPRACCPSHWDDQRALSSNGKLKGPVIHIPSDESYGKILGADSDLTIRIKMGNLFLAEPLVGIGRMLLRIGHLISGQWAWGQGYQEALKSWKSDRRCCAVNQQKAPEKFNLYTRVALRSLYRLSEAVLKLATLPIQMVLAILSTLVAIGDPLLSRRLFALTEEIWSINLGEWTFWDKGINYIAPCMQPTRVGEKLNLYRIYPDYDPKTVRSQAFSLMKLIKENSDYLSKKDEELFNESIQNLRINVKKISDDDVSEINLVEIDIRTQEFNNILEIRGKLSALSDTFKNYMTQADLAADHRIKNFSANSSSFQLVADRLLEELRSEFPIIVPN